MIKNRSIRGDFLFLRHEKTCIQGSGQGQQNNITQSGKTPGRYEQSFKTANGPDRLEVFCN